MWKRFFLKTLRRLHPPSLSFFLYPDTVSHWLISSQFIKVREGFSSGPQTLVSSLINTKMRKACNPLIPKTTFSQSRRTTEWKIDKIEKDVWPSRGMCSKGTLLDVRRITCLALHIWGWFWNFLSRFVLAR